MRTKRNHTLDLRTATEIVRAAIDPQLFVIEIKPLEGGMINHVSEWVLNGPPWSVVAKFSRQGGHEGIRNEYETLQWYRDHTTLPVPTTLALVEGPIGQFKGTCLLMRRVYGRHVDQARMSHEGRKHFQNQLADHLIELHNHRRETYGSALREGESVRWLDRFGPDFKHQFKAVMPKISRRSRVVVTKVYNELETLLPESNKPTLIHGDLWSNNILVDDSNPNLPQIVSFIDGHASFSDREYELAYLRCFQTADETFFRRYTRVHKIDRGFQTRCQIYWLPTLMRHVRYFGSRYLQPFEKLVDEVERMI